MDSYREHPSDFDLPNAVDASVADDVAAAIGSDERRMHVRAYNYWVSLLGGRDFPSIEDLEPGDVQDFAAHSLLLDFTCGRDNPGIPYIGGAIREECGLDENTRAIADVPSRSLLSRLTDHYMQIIANRAPVGFEAEFANQRSVNICYRGILMPFSSDGETIDFIYGVINWKAVDPAAAEYDPPVTEATSEVIDLAADDDTLLLDQPFALPADDGEAVAPVPHFSWQDGPLADTPDEDTPLPAITLDADAGLADRLSVARESADAVKGGEARTRTALYRALSLAYDFAVAARQNPDDYAELLEESGLKAQARAPMTPIVKLVFGIDYDKARLTEFAAALSYAQRQDVAAGAFEDFIGKQAGGLKALVAAEREARRPEGKADTRASEARTRLRAAPALSLSTLACAEEFGVLIARRRDDGGYEPVAIVEDSALVEKAIRRAA
ncbi:hypothetical protein [Sphingomonas sp.]|uniref:PAS domain-containing protein n=1 Tax=Sphingomonas sp. TaxID=28214 RepID=UPI0025DDD9AF|nr:hypothetical protein [Sphingomonas sp.]MBV9528146.1 hypothetical protein [Sphingomonas sp.]